MKNHLLKIFYPLLLTCITMIILFLPLKSGMFFGSEGDWYSQHVGIAESLRQTMLETHSLIPQWIHIGGGSSIYDFAYYGLLRPDILFSCLVPEINMKYIIAGYAVLGVLASVNLCYLWLKRQGISKRFAFAGAVLLASSACFYHAHHQIMFVNYMPFLFLALLGVDRLFLKRRIGLLIFSLFMIYIHSFYYAIACLLVIGVYALHRMLLQLEKEGIRVKGGFKRMAACIKGPAGRLIFSVIISIGMAMALLLPTGLDILSNEKDPGSFVTVPVNPVDWSLNGLLYSPYGCGMTLLTLYCILLSITKKRKRFMSVTLMFCVLFPVVSYVLNGFLYTRTKILIPFVPLFVFLTADTLQEFYQEINNRTAGKRNGALLVEAGQKLALLLLCLVPALHSAWKWLILLEGMLLFIWMLIQQADNISWRGKRCIFWTVLFVPVLLSISIHMSDSYLKPVCSRLGIDMSGTFLKAEDNRQNQFDREEIADFAEDVRYRFDVLSNSFVNANIVVNGSINRTAMYSSVTNADYAKFYYDTMKNPISLNNRVALVPSQNSCFAYFMGLKYLLAERDNLPYGYKTVKQKGNYILAQNDEVLPVCYGTTELFSSKAYEKLNFPDTLEALCSRAVVPVNMDQSISYTSHMQEENAKEFFAGDKEGKLLHPSGKKERFTLPLKDSIKEKILILTFHVESKNGGEVVICINGVKNKLSSENAPYPNNNHDFTYILSSEADLEELEVEVSRGEYTVDCLKIYTLDKKYLRHSDITVPEIKEQASDNGKNVFWGNITMKEDGYFVTSYPYRKGYQIKMDGVAVKPEKINTAFLGFPIAKGDHQIEIKYEAPGFELGYRISFLCFLIFGILLVLERKWVSERSGEKVQFKITDGNPDWIG